MATAIIPPPLDSTSLISKKAPRARPLLDPPIVRRAIGDSFRKLHPRPMMKNPVMFVVEVGALMTTVLAARDFAIGAHDVGFTFQITLWLWFTVLFANFAEAMAEGRGKAQAESLKKARKDVKATIRTLDGKIETVSSGPLKKGDIVIFVAGKIVPADGTVIEGVASVDESAITG